MTDPLSPPHDRAPAPTAPAVAPSPPVPPSAPRLVEPPAFRAHPLAPSGTCVNCGNQVGGARAVPRCWECGRALCAECYWRHGLTPADHRCAGCAARGPPPSTAISGGRVSAP
ncbi:MAG TPA: hypothetical protein VML53_08270 [Thermoplasmata archaeon]|nr:hypothetical protein [Thermoplasmata archaeon]